MIDTSAQVSKLVADRHRAMTPEERLRRVSSMFETARAIIESSLSQDLTVEERRLAVARRLYAEELPDAALTAHSKFRTSP